MGQTQTISHNNTTICTEGGKTTVTLHSTPIVTYDDVTIVLNNGGWNTVTTAARMNQVANERDLDFSVSRRGGSMVATYKGAAYDVAPIATIER